MTTSQLPWMRKAWCAGCVVLLGTPHSVAPGFTGGSLACAPAYVAAALGVVCGLWLASTSWANKLLQRSPAVLYGVGTAGLLVTVMYGLTGCVAVACELMRGSLFALIRDAMTLDCARLVLDVLTRGDLWSFVGGWACGFCASPLHAGDPLASVVPITVPVTVACALGFLQTWAWTALLPRVSWDGFLYTGGPAWVAGLLLAAPAVCIKRFVAAARHSSLGMLPMTLGAYAMGLVGFGLTARAFPMVQGWGSIAFLAIYLVGIELFAACCRRRVQAYEDGSFLLHGLSRDGRAFLDACGLSSQEVLVVGAAAQGLTGVQTAQILGVQSSTVREYRARCRRKTGSSTMDELVARVT